MKILKVRKDFGKIHINKGDKLILTDDREEGKNRVLIDHTFDKDVVYDTAFIAALERGECGFESGIVGGMAKER